MFRYRSKNERFPFKIERQDTYTFSKNFSYDPSVHSFRDTDWAIIQQLIEVHRSETVYREALSSFSSGYTLSNDRLLFIPPLAWERLLPKLTEATVRFEHGSSTYERMEITEGQVPLSFQLSKASFDGYHLNIQGLDHVTVMEGYENVRVTGV